VPGGVKVKIFNLVSRSTAPNKDGVHLTENQGQSLDKLLLFYASVGYYN
jgi:hypothetical protein